MPIQYSCTCGQKYTVQDDCAGKNIKCKKCNAIGIIPKALNQQKNNSSAKSSDEAIKTSLAIQNSSTNVGGKKSITTKSNSQTYKCPSCLETNDINSMECEHCGEIFLQPDELKYRQVSESFVMLSTIITLGVYAIFFKYRIYKELYRRGLTVHTPAKVVGYFFIPFYNIIWTFIVWSDIGDALEKGYREGRLPVPKVGLIKYWHYWYILSILTAGLAIPFLLIANLMAFASTQRLLNNLPELTADQYTNVNQQKSHPSRKDTLSLILACASIIFNIFTAIPAIIIGHSALNEIKKGDKIQNKKTTITALGISYLILLVSLIVSLYSINGAELEQRRVTSTKQLKQIDKFIEYQINFNKPVTPLDNMLKESHAQTNVNISPLSNMPYLYFPEMITVENKFNSWKQMGKILVYEQLPDKEGLRLYLGTDHTVHSLPEAQFHILLNEEKRKFISP